MDVAVIGLALRFPDSPDARAFLANLRRGHDAITRYTRDELLERGVAPGVADDPRFVGAGGFLESADRFDAGFFGYSPAEATRMDPQHRIALECAYETMEDAGYDARAYQGRIGVYCGAGLNTYWLRPDLHDELTGPQPVPALFASAPDFMATRIAYKLDTSGPAVGVQTACSTGLVAVHLACQALLTGDADMALAGAADLYYFDSPGYFYQEGGILSPDGACRAFDAGARGTLPGRGTAFVLLKSLAEARSDGDTIHAVIKGTAINNDGAGKVGYTAPSVDGQADVIHEAHALAGFAPESVGYIEAHGTGTALGDPIEVRALHEIFGQARGEKIGLGAVKTSIGHLGAAAGMAGLIKTILSLREGELFPSLHFESPAPALELEQGPFFVVKAPGPFPSRPGPRRAGVSSFGIGGTNAHVALEQAPEDRVVSRPDESANLIPFLLPLSARDEGALERLSDSLGEHLREGKTRSADVAYTQAVGRRTFARRRMVIARDGTDAARALSERDPAQMFSTPAGLELAGSPRLTLLFPGQGTQRAGMGRELYATDGFFRDLIDRGADIIRGLAGFDPRDFFLAAEKSDAQELTRTDQVQPLLFLYQVALARTLVERGLDIAAVLGHSLGEYSAACTAGVFSFEQGLEIVLRRGQLMQATAPGAMLAVGLGESAALEWAGSEVSLAAVNGAERCVLSGSAAAIASIEEQMRKRGVHCKRLEVAQGFHSPLMDGVLDEFRAFLGEREFSAPRLRLISNVTGRELGAADATDPDYWTRHLRAPVRFAAGLANIAGDPGMVCLETGPGRALSSLARGQIEPGRLYSIGGQRVPEPDKPDDSNRNSNESNRETSRLSRDAYSFYEGIARVWCAGVDCDWRRLFRAGSYRRVSLPTYPFADTRYKFDPERSTESKKRVTGTGATEETRSTLLRMPAWKRERFDPRVAVSGKLNAGAELLIFMDRSGVGAALLESMQAGKAPDADRGAPVRVYTGDGFARRGPRAYQIGSRSEEDLDRLFAALEADGFRPGVVCDLRYLSESVRTDQEEKEAPGDEVRDYFLAPLYLGRRLAGLSGRTPVRYLLCANGLYSLLETEGLSPLKALLAGPAAVLPREYPRLHCRLIDLEPVASFEAVTASEGLANVVRALRLEIERESVPRGSFAVAYRGRARWIREAEAFASGAVEERGDVTGKASQRLRDYLRPDGFYVIAGGTGGVGRHIAGLLRRIAPDCRIALLARSADESAADPILRVDLGESESVRAAMKAARERFGPIHGIVNAAGLGGSGWIGELDEAAVRRVLAPKVQGTLHLMEAAGDEPDFVLLCSSIAAESGHPGQADYTAANAFQDAFAAAQFSRPEGPRVLSIQWDRWRATGMTAPREDDPAGRDRSMLAEFAGDDPRSHSFAFVPRSDWLFADHRYEGRPLLPGTAYIELARAAADRQGAFRIAEALFFRPYLPREGEAAGLDVLLNGESGRERFSIVSRDDRGLVREHASGSFGPPPREWPEDWSDSEIAAARSRCARRRIGPGEFRRMMDATALHLNGRWHAPLEIFLGAEEALARVELPEAFAGDLDRYVLHPALLDLCIGFARFQEAGDELYLPLSYRDFAVRSPLPREALAHARLLRTAPGGETLSYEIRIMDRSGRLVAHLAEFTVKRAPAAALLDVDRGPVEPATTRNGAAAAIRSSGSRLEVSRRADALGGLHPGQALEALANLPLGVEPVIQIIADDDRFERRFAADPVDVPGAQSGPARLHPRPELKSRFAEPRDERERMLAGLWAETLGVGPLGIHDNFFELGGDSLLALRMVPRVREAGLAMEPASLFQHPTIAGLLAHLRAPAADGSEVTGATENPRARNPNQEKPGPKPDRVDPAQVARALKSVSFKKS